MLRENKIALGEYAPRMTSDDMGRMVDFLLEQMAAGYTVLTHNGLGFDFDFLAEETGRTVDCSALALAGQSLAQREVYGMADERAWM